MALTIQTDTTEEHELVPISVGCYRKSIVGETGSPSSFKRLLDPDDSPASSSRSFSGTSMAPLPPKPLSSGLSPSENDVDKDMDLHDLISLGREAPVNPFTNETSSSIQGPYEWAKVIILSPVFVLRLLIAIVLIVLAWIWTSLAMVGVGKNASQQPLPKWRQSLLFFPRFCARLGMFVSAGFYWIRVKGKPAPREEAPIVVSNHVSVLDPIYFFYYLLPINVSAVDHESSGFTVAFLQASQAITLDRSSPDSRKRTGEQIKRRALDNRWPRLMLFPEATTTNGRALISFKPGAFQAGLPVQPVVIRYPHRHADPSWGKISLPTLVFRIFTQFVNFMEVRWLDVIRPTPREINEPAVFSERVRRTMAEALGVPCTEHTWGDLALAVKAEQLRTRPSRGVGGAEMGKVRRLLRMDTKAAGAFLEKFADMDQNHSGVVSHRQFLAALDLPDTKFTKRVFKLFDAGDRGEIDFREFVAGLAFISKNTAFESSLGSVFRSVSGSSEDDSRLTQEGIETVLRQGFPEVNDEQMGRLFHSLGLGPSDTISWGEFRSFLRRNPEHLAVLLAYRPDILEHHKETEDGLPLAGVAESHYNHVEGRPDGGFTLHIQ